MRGERGEGKIMEDTPDAAAKTMNGQLSPATFDNGEHHS